MIKYKIKSAKDMTIDELIGQVIMVGLPGDYLDDDYKKFIKDKKIGNYILFARNYTDSKQMKSFMKDLYEYTLEVTNSYPLVSIDQEVVSGLAGKVTSLNNLTTIPPY